MHKAIRLPQVKHHLRVGLAPPDLVFFISESGYRLVRGKLIYEIVRLVDGIKSVTEIARLLKNQYTEFDVECGILLLKSEGYIQEKQDKAASMITGEHFGRIYSKLSSRRLKNASVEVISFSDVPASDLKHVLRRFGLRVSADAPFTVVMVDHYLQTELLQFSRIAREQNRAWMIVKISGDVLWIGPVFFPGRNACWQCLALRLRDKARVDAYLRVHGSFTNAGLPVNSPAASIPALEMAATEIVKCIAGYGSREQALITLDIKNRKLERHAVKPIDHCPACGNYLSASPQPLILKSCKKTAFDCGHRSSSAEETFRKFAYHISFRTGIVDQLVAIENTAEGLVHSIAADHLFVPVLKKSDLLRKGLTQKSWGKGVTLQQAKTSALCEALERYSGVFRGNESRIKKSYEDLPEDAVHVEACLNFSQTQYQNRHTWNRNHSGHDWVPVRFNAAKQIEWSPAWSLTNNRSKYLPTAYCYYGYRLPRDHHFCQTDSNGNAAGNTIEEAILHGILEVVERDCAALWWHNRLKRPSVDLASFDFPYFLSLHKYYAGIQRELWILDITNDFEIPCFAALSAMRNGKPQYLLGLGAHLDPVVAMSRALTEMNQFLEVRKAGATRNLNEDFLKPTPLLAPRTFNDFKQLASDDIRDDILFIVNLAKHRGMEVLVIDQTRTDVGLPVVKVIVPGMRQVWRRYAPGRLYDVPVQLGWLKEPLKETQLNPHPFLI